jgi:hypothetical protein
LQEPAAAAAAAAAVGHYVRQQLVVHAFELGATKAVNGYRRHCRWPMSRAIQSSYVPTEVPAVVPQTTGPVTLLHLRLPQSISGRSRCTFYHF